MDYEGTQSDDLSSGKPPVTAKSTEDTNMGHISKLAYKVSFLNDVKVAATDFPRRLIVMMVSLFLGGFNL